jgi:hypothetical protein
VVVLAVLPVELMPGALLAISMPVFAEQEEDNFGYLLELVVLVQQHCSGSWQPMLIDSAF